MRIQCKLKDESHEWNDGRRRKVLEGFVSFICHVLHSLTSLNSERNDVESDFGQSTRSIFSADG